MDNVCAFTNGETDFSGLPCALHLIPRDLHQEICDGLIERKEVESCNFSPFDTQRNRTTLHMQGLGSHHDAVHSSSMKLSCEIGPHNLYTPRSKYFETFGPLLKYKFPYIAP